LIGRDGELSQLSDLVDPPPIASRVRVLRGEPGMGKTFLLNEVARRAGSAGLRVLTVTGRESERDLAFAGLHQLLRPVLDRVSTLPERQARALLGAFALAPDPVPPDALLTGIAVLTLLSGLAGDGPMLVAVDDAQWLDRASVDTLAFAARRLDSEPLVLLLAVRGTSAPPGFDRDFPELILPPLGISEAARLLDQQPHPPRGRAREQVLAQAIGNPLALIELSKVIAADPAAGRRWTAQPLPLTDRLTAAMAAQFGGLPRSARAALLLAAVADSPDVAARVPGLDAGALAPAEQAGLIRVDGSGPQFTHPLVRAAVYHAVPHAERAAAHLRIADTLRDQPDRHAWHLAAAALEPDERLAALLDDTAAQTQRRGGAGAAARALERAAELSPAEADQARRLLAAAGLAMAAGQADWVQDLAARVLAVTADPPLRVAAQQRIGWALVWSNQHAAALTTLLSVAAEAASLLPVIAWNGSGWPQRSPTSRAYPATGRRCYARWAGCTSRPTDPPIGPAGMPTSSACGSGRAPSRWAPERTPSHTCTASPAARPPTRPRWARRPGCSTRPSSRYGYCARHSAGCAPPECEAVAGPPCPRCNGPASTADGGTKRSRPPGRRATRPPRTGWKLLPRRPTSPAPRCSPCAAISTGCSRS
jgi:hypothetical protein